MSSSNDSMAGLRVLLVEDEYLIALNLGTVLQSHGATVVGPASSVGEALALIAENERIDLAILDVNLLGHPVYPVADALRHAEIPFMFATACTADSIAGQYADVPRLGKPFNPEDVEVVLSRDPSRGASACAA